MNTYTHQTIKIEQRQGQQIISKPTAI